MVQHDEVHPKIICAVIKKNIIECEEIIFVDLLLHFLISTFWYLTL